MEIQFSPWAKQFSNSLEDWCAEKLPEPDKDGKKASPIFTKHLPWKAQEALESLEKVFDEFKILSNRSSETISYRGSLTTCFRHLSEAQALLINLVVQTATGSTREEIGSSLFSIKKFPRGIYVENDVADENNKLYLGNDGKNADRYEAIVLNLRKQIFKTQLFIATNVSLLFPKMQMRDEFFEKGGKEFFEVNKSEIAKAIEVDGKQLPAIDFKTEQFVKTLSKLDSFVDDFFKQKIEEDSVPKSSRIPQELQHGVRMHKPLVLISLALLTAVVFHTSRWIWSRVF